MFELISLLALIVAFIVAITVHEASHAWMADRLGDPTPRLLGRLSLNPIVHYDRVGTTLLIGLLLLQWIGMPVFPFGWAKPVPFDPYNLKNPRRDAALISFAGPASNFILAALLALPYHFGVDFGLLLDRVIFSTITLNVMLGVFNLLPIHPLDGGKIFIGLLPEREAHDANSFLERYGFIILLFLLMPTVDGRSPISFTLIPIIQFILGILLPGAGIF